MHVIGFYSVCWTLSVAVWFGCATKGWTQQMDGCLPSILPSACVRERVNMAHLREQSRNVISVLGDPPSKSPPPLYLLCPVTNRHPNNCANWQSLLFNPRAGLLLDLKKTNKKKQVLSVCLLRLSLNMFIVFITIVIGWYTGDEMMILR